MGAPSLQTTSRPARSQPVPHLCGRAVSGRRDGRGAWRDLPGVVRRCWRPFRLAVRECTRHPVGLGRDERGAQRDGRSEGQARCRRQAPQEGHSSAAFDRLPRGSRPHRAADERCADRAAGTGGLWVPTSVCPPSGACLLVAQRAAAPRAMQIPIQHQQSLKTASTATTFAMQFALHPARQISSSRQS